MAARAGDTRRKMAKLMSGRTSKAPGKKIHRAAGAATTGSRAAAKGISGEATSRRVVAGLLEAAERHPRVAVQEAGRAPARATSGRTFLQTRMAGSAPEEASGLQRKKAQQLDVGIVSRYTKSI